MTQTAAPTIESVQAEIKAIRDLAGALTAEDRVAVSRLMDDAWRALLVGGARSAGARYRIGVARAIVRRAAA